MGSLRGLAVFAVMAVVGMAGMYLFAANQVSEVQGAPAARAVQSQLQRSLAESPETTIRMRRTGSGPDARPHYLLTLHPSAAVQAEPAAVSRLMQRAARIVGAKLASERNGDMIVSLRAQAGGETVTESYDRVGRLLDGVDLSVFDTPDTDEESSR